MMLREEEIVRIQFQRCGGLPLRQVCHHPLS